MGPNAWLDSESSSDSTGGLVHGIVLAGAYPRTGSTLDRLSPRPLLPVAQKPLIAYSLRWMREAGVQRATICANTAARQLRTALDPRELGLDLDYLEDWTPRGAAGCVRDAGMFTKACTFVVADGTTIPTVDLADLLEAHRESRATLTVVSGLDRGVDGGPSGGRLRPTGLYVFDRQSFAFIPEQGYQDIKERLIPSLYRAGRIVATYTARGVCPRVLDNETYLAMNHWAIRQTIRQSLPSQGFRLAGDAMLHDTSDVEPGARLLGPVLLGPGVSVRSGATVVGPASLGSGTTVGEGAVVSRSVVWSGCTVGERAFVDRCMLADGVHVTSSTSLQRAVKAPRSPRVDPEVTSPSDARGWMPFPALLRPPAPNHP